jgi:hypothetical protein
MKKYGMEVYRVTDLYIRVKQIYPKIWGFGVLTDTDFYLDFKHTNLPY